MGIEESSLLKVFKKKLNPAHLAFLHSQGKEKNTDREWSFSSSDRRSFVSQKNGHCSPPFIATKTSDNPWHHHPLCRGLNSGVIVVLVCIWEKVFRATSAGNPIFHQKFRMDSHIDLLNCSIWATMEPYLLPDTGGCWSAWGCPAGKSGMTSHAFNLDCYISFLVQVQYDT